MARDRGAAALIAGSRIGVVGERSPVIRSWPRFGQGCVTWATSRARIVVTGHRYAHGALDRVPKITAELVRLGVNLFVVGGTVSAHPAKTVTTTSLLQRADQVIQ